MMSNLRVSVSASDSSSARAAHVPRLHLRLVPAQQRTAVVPDPLDVVQRREHCGPDLDLARRQRRLLGRAQREAREEQLHERRAELG